MTTQAKPKPATIYIEVSEQPVIEHKLADEKDWGIMDNTILSVSVQDETFYYPLDSVKQWSVKAYRKKLAHFYPVEIHNGVEREEEEGNRRLSEGNG